MTTIPRAAPDVTADGTDESATCSVAPAVTENEPLVLLVSPVLAAVMVKLPAVSRIRLEKIAWPEELVTTDVVDEGSKEPALRDTVTVTPAWSTLLLPESRS